MKFEQVLTMSDATSTGDGKTIPNDDYMAIWKKRIPAQSKYFFGTGKKENGVDDRGILYLDIKDDSEDTISGYVRLEVRNANENKKKVLMERRTENLSASKTKQTEAFRLGKFKTGAKEDSYLVILMKADEEAEFSKSNSDFNIPVTTVEQ